MQSFSMQEALHQYFQRGLIENPIASWVFSAPGGDPNAKEHGILTNS